MPIVKIQRSHYNMKISCDAILSISGIYLIKNNVNNKVYVAKEKLINIYLITIKNLINGSSHVSTIPQVIKAGK